MATDGPLFYDDVRAYIDWALFVFSTVIGLWAFIHCLVQRSEAFPAIGTLPKGAWLAIIGISVLLTFLLFGPVSMFGLIAIAASLIYLLDVRIGLRDLTDGQGRW